MQHSMVTRETPREFEYDRFLDETNRLRDNTIGSRPGNRSFTFVVAGGKSGLRRAGCQVTPGGREPTESATENIPPRRTSVRRGKGEMVW